MVRFLNNFYDYPVSSSHDEALRFLRDDFTRAVALHVDGLEFDSAQIMDVPGYDGTEAFWHDPNRSKFGRRIPGETMYTLGEETPQNAKNELTVEAIQHETLDAGVLVAPEALAPLHKNLMLAMTTFSDIVRDHTQTDDFYMRGWLMFAPAQAQGRTPVPHIDRTILTGLWYAGRASAEIYTGTIKEKVWAALSPQRDNDHQLDPVLQDFGCAASADDFFALPVGPLIVTRNSKGKDLNDPASRRTVCVHRSGNVADRGQAGIVMVPKFLD